MQIATRKIILNIVRKQNIVAKVLTEEHKTISSDRKNVKVESARRTIQASIGGIRIGQAALTVQSCPDELRR